MLAPRRFFRFRGQMPGQDSDGMLASDGSEAIPALIEGNERGASPASSSARARTRPQSPLGFLGFDVEDEPELRSGDLRRQGGGAERTACRPD